MPMEEKPIRVYKERGVLINVRDLSEDDIDWAIRKWTVRLYKDGNCAKCPTFEDRHGENCDSCASYEGARQLAKTVERGNSTLLSLPFGATERIRRFLHRLGGNYTVIDRNAPDTPLSRPIAMTIPLYPFQVEAVDALIKARKGVLKAPPRAGKTVAAAAVVAKLGLKTLILATQRDWLEQFRETFIGSATAKACTTARPSQVAFCKTFEDFEATDVALATPQQFMNPRGKALLERVAHLFPVTVIDEIHLTPALATSQVVAQLNSRYRFGLSGTTERKQQGLYAIVENLVGPVVYEAKVERLRPRVELLHTNVKFADPKGGDAAFARFISSLETNAQRRKRVVDRIVRAVKDGHMVLVPVQRVRAVVKLVKDINDKYGKRIALPFTGALHKDTRKATIEAARSYKCKVLVGQIRLLSTGLNIPRASCIIEYTLSSNRPQAIQRVARVLTPMDGKPEPLVVFVCDDSNIMRKTRQNEWWNAIHPEFKPIVPGPVYKDLLAWLASQARTSLEGSDLTDLI